MDDLKPCPFCGGEAERIDIEDDDGHSNQGGSVIQCSKCLASSRVEFERRENLASAWNVRGQYPPASIPICCVTGRVAGDHMACGDCDPCIFGAHLVPGAVKRLIAERDELCAKFEEAMGLLEAATSRDGSTGAIGEGGPGAEGKE